MASPEAKTRRSLWHIRAQEKGPTKPRWAGHPIPKEGLQTLKMAEILATGSTKLKVDVIFRRCIFFHLPSAICRTLLDSLRIATSPFRGERGRPHYADKAHGMFQTEHNGYL
jgi:hypothetical protein